MDERLIALVTGASRGIGKAVAIELAAAGLDVAVSARTMMDGTGRLEPGSDIVVPGGLDTTVEAIRRQGATGIAVPMDLLDGASVQSAVSTVLDSFGRIDVLINNAVFQGPGTLTPFDDVTDEEMRSVFEGNVFAQLALVRAVLPGMVDRERGTIVNMVSGAGFQAPPAKVGEGGWSVAYAMTKAALGRVAPVLHVEYAERGLRLFSVDPGLTLTERMVAAGRADLYRRHFAAATPDLIGRVVRWLVTSEEADDLRGTVVMAQSQTVQQRVASAN